MSPGRSRTQYRLAAPFAALSVLLTALACTEQGPPQLTHPVNNAVAAGSPGCKRGIASTARVITNPALAAGLSWRYNWSVSSEPDSSRVEFTPMIWGDRLTQEEALAEVRPDAKFLLGFNEPNFFAQANLSARAAAELWPLVEEVAAARGVPIVSPAVNYCGPEGQCHDTNPVSYLEEFFANCVGCRVDYVAVHWYNCSADSLRDYLALFKHFGKPLWLTEFACAYDGDSSLAGQEAYMREAVPLLEADPDVFRYAWFSADPIPQALLEDASGGLTPLGELYVSLPHNADCDL